jgi:hypothetical protein
MSEGHQGAPPIPEVVVIRRAGRSQSEEGIFATTSASKRTDDRRHQRELREAILADEELRRAGLKR